MIGRESGDIGILRFLNNTGTSKVSFQSGSDNDLLVSGSLDLTPVNNDMHIQLGNTAAICGGSEYGFFRNATGIFVCVNGVGTQLG